MPIYLVSYDATNNDVLKGRLEDLDFEEALESVYVGCSDNSKEELLADLGRHSGENGNDVTFEGLVVEIDGEKFIGTLKPTKAHQKVLAVAFKKAFSA